MTNLRFLNLARNLTLVYATVFVGTIAVIAITTVGLRISEHGLVGPDFLAFYTSGTLTNNGNALGAYDQEIFETGLRAFVPDDQPLGLMWQYPPTMFFLTTLLAAIPYKISYFLWMAATWTALGFAIKAISARSHAWILLTFSPLTVPVVISGQISLGTAALLVLAAWKPKSQWLLAGLMAGLLTLKPQLGILLPVAFLATGAYRAFFTAAVSGILLHLPSFIVFGIDGWLDFLAAVRRLGEDVAGPGQNTPPDGMTTIFGQLRVIGVPSWLALSTQYGVTIFVATVVWSVFRKDDQPPLGVRPDFDLARCSVLCSGAVLASPYAYAYEMTALVPVAFLLGIRARHWSSPLGFLLIGSAALMLVRTSLLLWLPLQIPFLISAIAFAMAVAVAYERLSPWWATPLFDDRSDETAIART